MRGSGPVGLVSSFRHECALEVGNQRFQLRAPGVQPHKHIPSDQERLITPEPFPKQALGTITINGARKETLGYDQTQPGIVQTVGSDLDGNQPCAARPGERKDLGDRVAAEPLRLPESLSAPQTPRRSRPFARRARITALPPRVRMRTRNPCVRLRRTTDG